MMNTIKSKSGFFLCILLLSIPLSLFTQDLQQLQSDFVDLRFGVFLHFGIRTFTGGGWGEANQDVTQFNPTSLDCGQWADAAVSANMKYGILTTKHHDGFCLWDSAYTTNDVASSPWQNGQGDVVQEYVDAFRSRGLAPCLYYSIWDSTEPVTGGSESEMTFIKGQLTELLSNYGEIPLLIIDGWSWFMGHKEVPYQVIRELVKELQPNCLLSDHAHLRCMYDVDTIFFEAGSPCPEDNTYPSTLSALINSGGNGWFWSTDVPTATLMSTDYIVSNLEYVEPKWCAFLLNCPPNNQGLLDSNIVARLGEVGQAWSPDESRPSLPAMHAQNEHPITPASATATSGNADYAIDGKNDRGYYTVWESSSSFPQSVTIDLGMEHPDVNILYYVPKYIPSVSPQLEGSITSYCIYKSTDGTSFTEIASGSWEGDTTMKVVTFTPTNARYIRLEALAGNDGFAAATEIAIGAESRAAVPGDPSSTPSPTDEPSSDLGDVNNDRVTDIVDALLIAQYYVGLAPSPFDQSNADTNCDGSIDIIDALLVAQYYVGLITEFC